MNRRGRTKTIALLKIAGLSLPELRTFFARQTALQVGVSSVPGALFGLLAVRWVLNASRTFLHFVWNPWLLLGSFATAVLLGLVIALQGLLKELRRPMMETLYPYYTTKISFCQAIFEKNKNFISKPKLFRATAYKRIAIYKGYKLQNRKVQNFPKKQKTRKN